MRRVRRVRSGEMSGDGEGVGRVRRVRRVRRGESEESEEGEEWEMSGEGEGEWGE